MSGDILEIVGWWALVLVPCAVAWWALTRG
jgi:hypothetical protein